MKLFVDSAVTGRKLERPWLGAKLDAVNRELAEALGLQRVAGALVVRLYDKSPAAEAGLQAGDVIVAVDGHDVDDARAVLYRLTTRGIGNRVARGCRSQGPARDRGRGAARRARPGRDDVRNLSGAHPFDGARAANILPAIADELGLDDQEGVVLLSVRPNSTAARLGFQAGDIVVQVGQERITTVVQLEGALRERQRSWLMLVRRGNQVLRLQVAG